MRLPIALCLTLLPCGLAAQPRERAELDVGAEAPPLDAVTWISERPALEGKTVVIDFWATWCGPCIAAMPHFDALAERYAGEDVAFVALATLDTPDAVRAFARERGMRAAVAHEDSLLWNAFGARYFPRTYVITPDGRVAWRGRTPQLTAAVLDGYLRTGVAAAPVLPADLRLARIDVTLAPDTVVSSIGFGGDSTRFSLTMQRHDLDFVLTQTIRMALHSGRVFSEPVIERVGDPPLEPLFTVAVRTGPFLPPMEAGFQAADYLARMFGVRLVRPPTPGGTWMIDYRATQVPVLE